MTLGGNITIIHGTNKHRTTFKNKKLITMKTLKKLITASLFLLLLAITASSCGASKTDGCGYWGHENFQKEETNSDPQSSETKISYRAIKDS